LTDHDGPLAGRRCLVLDDEFLIALDIQNVLETAGAILVSVAAADEALNLLGAGQRFDLAIIDVELGATATSMAVTGRLDELKIPFIFLTGMHSDEVRARHPDVPVVEKSYVAGVLMKALHRVLAGK
jgi:CheY-like chemotaxis protein